MNDSDEREALAAKRDRNRSQRIQAVKRWAEYIETTPVEEWGPQHAKLVDSQLDAARSSGLSAEHYRRVDEAGKQFRRDQREDD